MDQPLKSTFYVCAVCGRDEPVVPPLQTPIFAALDERLAEIPEYMRHKPIWELPPELAKHYDR